jgi:hypothetical protein
MRERTAMLEFENALLCDYVRPESGVAHVIAAGVDTIYRPEVPSVANLGFFGRVVYTDEDLDEPHQFELRLHDQDGQQVARVNALLNLSAVEGLPEGWPYAMILAINFGVPLPRHGTYTLTALLDETLRRTINLRVVPPEEDTDRTAG